MARSWPGPPIEPTAGVVIVRDEHGRIPLGCAHQLCATGRTLTGEVDIRPAAADQIGDAHILINRTHIPG